MDVLLTLDSLTFQYQPNVIFTVFAKIQNFASAGVLPVFFVKPDMKNLKVLTVTPKIDMEDFYV